MFFTKNESEVKAIQSTVSDKELTKKVPLSHLQKLLQKSVKNS